MRERERELQAKTTLYALDYKKAAVMLLNHAFSVATSLNGLIGIWQSRLQGWWHMAVPIPARGRWSSTRHCFVKLSPIAEISPLLPLAMVRTIDLYQGGKSLHQCKWIWSLLAIGIPTPLSESLEQGQPLGYGFFTHFQHGTEQLREERNILARVSEMDRNLRLYGIRGLKFWILGRRKVFRLFWLGWNRTHKHE